VWRIAAVCYNLAACKVIVSLDVRFNENAFTHRGEMLTRALRTDTDYIPIQDHQLDDIYENMTYEQQLRAAIRISKQEERQRQGQVASDETAQPDTNAPAPSQQA